MINKSQIQSRFLILTSTFCLLTFYFSCERNSTPYTQTPPQLTLSAEYVTVTEALIQVHSDNISDEQHLKVWRDTNVVFNGVLDTANTTIYDSTLLPAHEYTYNAAIIKNGNNLIESLPLKLTTMDTTSHDFQWELFNLGSSGSSVLYDVSIVNENDIWAVGTVHTTETDTFDSLGNWVPPYNALHWDGQQWELKRILYQGGFWEINTIFAFSSTDIWFEAFVKWNGENFIELPIPGILIGHGINKMWGTSSNGLYVVGSEGFVAHYNGSGWQKIESGTELPINDIWGAKDDETGENYVLCPASYKFQLDEKKLLRINPDLSIEEENWPFQDRRVHSVWFKNKYHVFICGAGVFLRNRSGQYNEFNEIPLIFTERIRGNDINDLFVAGDFGILAHYNGINWKVYPDAALGLYRSLDYKGDIAVAVGEEAGKAVILMIKR